VLSPTRSVALRVKRSRAEVTEKGWYYRADTEVCAGCSLRSQCTKTAHPSHTRLIVRSEGHELLIQGWAEAGSREAKRDRRRRMTLIEGSFGQAAQNHHFKRSRYRRLWRQSIQDHLIAAVQNIKKIVRHAPRGGNTAGWAATDIVRQSMAQIFYRPNFGGQVLACP
jgi:hypothetical protein